MWNFCMLNICKVCQEIEKKQKMYWKGKRKQGKWGKIERKIYGPSDKKKICLIWNNQLQINQNAYEHDEMIKWVLS